MKRVLFVLLFLSVFSIASRACDICAIYSWVNPNDYSHSVTMLYRSRLLQGNFGASKKSMSLRHGGTEEEGTLGKEIYNSVELRLLWMQSPKNRFQLILPMVNNYQSVGGYTTFDIYSPSDPVLLFDRAVIQSQGRREERKVTHRLRFGGGIKLPLANKEMKFNEILLPKDLQPSSGSWDFLITSEYAMVRKVYGIAVSQSFKLNGYDKWDFKYGNQWNASVDVFFQRSKKVGKLIVPKMGYWVEHAWNDQYREKEFENSSFTVGFLSMECDAYLDKVAFRLQFQPALWNRSEGNRLPVKNRWILGFTWTL